MWKLLRKPWKLCIWFISPCIQIIHTTFHIKRKTISKLNAGNYDYFIANRVLLFDEWWNSFQSLTFRPRSISSLWIPRCVNIVGIFIVNYKIPVSVIHVNASGNGMGRFCWDLYIRTSFIAGKIVLFMVVNIATSNIPFAKRLSNK